MDALQTETSTTNVFSDPLTVYFGPDKGGRLKAMGSGLTKTKYMLLQERDDHIDGIEEKQKKMEEQLGEVLQQLRSLTKNQVI